MKYGVAYRVQEWLLSGPDESEPHIQAGSINMAIGLLTGPTTTRELHLLNYLPASVAWDSLSAEPLVGLPGKVCFPEGKGKSLPVHSSPWRRLANQVLPLFPAEGVMLGTRGSLRRDQGAGGSTAKALVG